MKTASAICFTALLLSSATAFQHGSGKPFRYQNRAVVQTRREMKSSSLQIEGDEGSGTGRRFEPASKPTSTYMKNNDRAKMTSLSVATLEGAVESSPADGVAASLSRRLDLDAITKVLSASLFITGNTVGTSMFVLPEAVGGVGMVCGSALFLGIYVYNLISGLLLANVAIELHESSDCEVPSSFKDFVDTAMESEAAGTAMAGASLLSNSCFLAFGTLHAGSLLSNAFPEMGLDPAVGASAFAAIIALFSVTQTNKGLESIANAGVVVLFASFLSLLLPSMATVSDPIGTIMSPGTNPSFPAAIAAAFPLILSSLTYQNIVPSITKLLDFDRTKTTIAVALGSLIPMLMYVAWCYVSLGGGLDSSVASGAGAAAFGAFSASALVGSCLAAVMSIAEEYESIITSVVKDDEICAPQDKFSIPAVALSMAPPTALALAFSGGGDLTGAIHFNGAIITPFLYGILPIALYHSVQQKKEANNGVTVLPSLSSLSFPQVMLGAGAVGGLGQEIVADVSTFAHNWMM